MQLFQTLLHEDVRPRLLKTLIYLALYVIGLNIVLPSFNYDWVVNEATSGFFDVYDPVEEEGIIKIIETYQEQTQFRHYMSVFSLGATTYYLVSLFGFFFIPLLFRNSGGQ